MNSRLKGLPCIRQPVRSCCWQLCFLCRDYEVTEEPRHALRLLRHSVEAIRPHEASLEACYRLSVNCTVEALAVNADAARETVTHPVGELFAHVAMIFQNPEAQLFSSTVEQELAFGLESLGLPQDEIRQRVRESA